MSNMNITLATSSLSRHDYETLAKRANLRYVSDEEAGFSRHRWGRGFTYKDSLGNTVKDKVLRQRFEDLVIPPMWSEVWICQYEDGHLQATGRDDKGRKQYLYHVLWDDIRSRVKFDAMIGFGEALPNLRAQVEQDLQADELSRDNVLAAVIKLLETTLIRVGNPQYAKRNNSYGLSTLRSRHVSETDEGLAFDFVGKSAKTHHIELQDERLIDIVQACSDLPGYRIFKYIDKNGDKQVVESQDINDYIRTHIMQDKQVSQDKPIPSPSKNSIASPKHTVNSYSAKDFRTWHASVLAANYLYENVDQNTLKNSDDKQELKQREQYVVDMVKDVAAQLGNTPSVCRRSYIHPKVIETFLQGEFYERYAKARRGRTRRHQQVEEKALLAFLQAD